MDHAASLPPAYCRTIRTLVRFACLMTVIGLLGGLAYRESAKQLTYEQAGAGLRVEAVLPLALFHGHLFTTAVILPLVLAVALFLALRVGGRELTSRNLAWVTRVYLPFTLASLALLLVKGYHVLLGVRRGETDLQALDAALLGGAHVVRYIVYAVAHTGMAVGLGVFVLALWRSLKGKPAA